MSIFAKVFEAFTFCKKSNYCIKFFINSVLKKTNQNQNTLVQ